MYETVLADGAERQNPFHAPLVLLDAADGPATEALGVIVQYIDQLPAEFKAGYDRYFDPEQFDDLRHLHSGLVKLRGNTMPSADELRAISNARDVLWELAEAFEEAAVKSVIPLELEQFIDANISIPLQQLSETLIPERLESMVSWWVDEVTKAPPTPFGKILPPGL